MTDVSVVVATRDRAGRLRRLLDSLAAQREATFEVIVVDDGSTDETADVLASVADMELRALRLEPSRGPAAARNAGWPLARAPLVAFTDDDCVATPRWLATLVARHGEEPDAVLQGRTEPDPAEVHRQSAFSRSQLVTELGVNFQTCNVAYPRVLLEALGGFDESFPHYAEDADLAWRAQEAGAPALFVPDALVHHAVHPAGPLDALRDSQRWADAVRCFARHPQMRRAFRRGVFWRPQHEALLLALAGARLARRSRGASLVLCAPYLRFARSQHGSWPGALAWLPAHVLVDVAEVAAMLRGSARHRTLVL